MGRVYKKLVVLLAFLSLNAHAQHFGSVAFNKLPKDMQLYAREDNNFADVPIGGKIEEAGWHHMSVVTFRNSVRTGYNKAVLNYAGKSFADFSMKPKIKSEMADYSFEVYACHQSDSVLIVRRNDIAAGDFFVINGQSNALALKYGDWGSKYCRTVARLPDDNPAITQGDSLWIQASWSWPYVGAWGLQLQRSMLETYGIPTCVINGALPGSKIATHVDRDSQNPANSSLYGLLLTRVKVANPTRIRNFFWLQGEQEALEDIRDYPAQYDKLFKYWQIDYPTVEKFTVLQISILFNPFYVAGTIRDFLRRTKYLYAKSDHFSTMGLPYYDGVHFDIKGYQELGKRLFNYIGPGLNKSTPIDNAACPDIRKAFYTSDKKDEITLVFDEGQKLVWPRDTLVEDLNNVFFKKSLREVFYFEGNEDESQPAVVKEGSVTGNRVKLVLQGSITAKKLNYLPAYKGEKVRIYNGPFLTNIKGLGAFSFQNVDINDALLMTNVKAIENGTGAVDITWNATAGATYILYRKAEGESTFSKLADLANNKLSYNDQNVVRNKLYAYQIQAISSLSESKLVEVTIKTSSALPVTLTSFKAFRINENAVTLKWNTASETNNLEFEIQRSTNPLAGFTMVGRVDGAGNSSSANNYEFTDNAATATTTYYRLKQIDFNGTFTYSRILKVLSYKMNLSVKAFPNPSVLGKAQFKVSGIDPGEIISVWIYDAKGIVVYKNDGYLLNSDSTITIDSFKNQIGENMFVKIVYQDQEVTSSFVSY